MKYGKMMIIKITNALNQQRKAEFSVMAHWIKLAIMYFFLYQPLTSPLCIYTCLWRPTTTNKYNFDA